MTPLPQQGTQLQFQSSFTETPSSTFFNLDRASSPGSDDRESAEEPNHATKIDRTLKFYRLRFQNNAISISHVRIINLSTYTTGQTWGALRKAWKAYKIAKVQNDSVRMKEYSQRIRTLQTQLGVPQSTFHV